MVFLYTVKQQIGLFEHLKFFHRTLWSFRLHRIYFFWRWVFQVDDSEIIQPSFIHFRELGRGWHRPVCSLLVWKSKFLRDKVQVLVCQDRLLEIKISSFLSFNIILMNFSSLILKKVIQVILKLFKLNFFIWPHNPLMGILDFLLFLFCLLWRGVEHNIFRALGSFFGFLFCYSVHGNDCRDDPSSREVRRACIYCCLDLEISGELHF